MVGCLDATLAALILCLSATPVENRHIWRQVRHVGGDVRTPADVRGVKIKAAKDAISLESRCVLQHIRGSHKPDVLLSRGISVIGALLQISTYMWLTHGPSTRSQRPGAVVNQTHPDLVMHAQSGGLELFGRFFSPTIGHADPKRAPAVLLLHGIPGTEQNFDIAYALRQAGIHCLMFHYRGCWGSPGTYAITNLEEDIDAAVSWLCEQPNVDTDKLVVVGHSLGGYHTLRMAISGAMLAENKTDSKLMQVQRVVSDVGFETEHREPSCVQNVYQKIRSFAALCPLVGTDDIGVPLSQELSTEFASFLSNTTGPELQEQWAGLRSVKDMLRPLYLSQTNASQIGLSNTGEARQAYNSPLKEGEPSGASTGSGNETNVLNESTMIVRQNDSDGSAGREGEDTHIGKGLALRGLLGHLFRKPGSKTQRTRSKEQILQEEKAAKDSEDQIRRRGKPLLLITGDEDPLFSNEYYRKHLIAPLDNSLSFRYDWITKKHGDHALSRYRPEVVRHVVSFVCRSVGHNRWYMGERTACASRWIEAAPWDIFFIFAMGMFAGSLSVREEYSKLQRQLVGQPPVDLEEADDD